MPPTKKTVKKPPTREEYDLVAAERDEAVAAHNRLVGVLTDRLKVTQDADDFAAFCEGVLALWPVLD